MNQTRSYHSSVQAMQIIVWVCLTLFLVFYSANKWAQEPRYAIFSALIACASYAPAVYGNAHFLWPRFFAKGRTVLYVIYSILFIGIIVVARMLIENAVLMPLHHAFYDWNLSHFSLSVITVSVAYLFGAFLRMAINYVTLSKTQEEMKRRQTMTELELLKQHVQPHFLFNTLNNIYSLAHSKSDNTTVAIDKLANIMRYFTEDAPREMVSLKTETGFIENYILLEQMRMLHPVSITKKMDNADTNLPPMLLMPFIENLFKHGVDKTRDDNEAFIELSVNDGRLFYQVKNRMYGEVTEGNGTGLNNLRKRLYLLYGNDQQLETRTDGNHFYASLNIPV